MADDNIAVADPATGVEEVNTSVPETSVTEQSAPELQSVAPVQVENKDNQPQTVEPPKPDYQGLYKADRKRIRRLEETINQLSKRLEQPSPAKDDPAKIPLDHNLINQDVDKYLSLREQKTLAPYEQRLLALERALQDKSYKEAEQKQLGALEKLYPKASPDSNETLEDRVNRDPAYSQKLMEFFNTPFMKEMSMKDPDGAVDYAVFKLGLNKPVNPTVIKKSAMGGTATGNMGGKNLPSEQDLRSELKKLSDQADNNPEMRKDEKFLKRKAEVMQSLESLLTRRKG